MQAVGEAGTTRIKRSSHIVDSLSLLHKSSSKVRDLSRERMILVANEYGNNTLPDELLLRIFTLVRAMGWFTPYFIKGVFVASAVCKRSPKNNHLDVKFL